MLKQISNIPPIEDVTKSSVVVSYLRTVQITFGVYPFPDEINNFIIEIKNNLDKDVSYATNVKGGMTDWKYFVDKPSFQKFLTYFINQNQLTNQYLQNFHEKRYVREAWGNELNTNDHVAEHSHLAYHGILYLTSGNPLILPELNMEIHPQPGEYYLFPPEIRHRVDPVKENQNTRYNLIFNFDNQYNWLRDKKINQSVRQEQ